MSHRQELKMYPSTMLEKASILIKASINLHERSSPYVILVIILRKNKKLKKLKKKKDKELTVG